MPFCYFENQKFFKLDFGVLSFKRDFNLKYTNTEMIAKNTPTNPPEIIVEIFVQIQGSSSSLWHSGTPLHGTANIVTLG